MTKIRRSLVIGIFLAMFVLPLALPRVGEAVPLAEQKAAAKAKAQRIRRQLEVLDVALEQTIERYNLANLQLDQAEERVAKSTRELKVARFDLRVSRETLRNRVVAMYKQRPIDIVDVIFASRSFDELASQLHTVRQISERDSEIVDEVERREAAVQAKREQLVEDRAEIRRLVADIKTKKQNIESTLAARRVMLRGVEKEIKRIEREEAAAAARAARAAAAAARNAIWRNPREIPPGPAGPGHPEVIEIAKRYLGVPYVYAAADPNVGFDCSGLVMYCYAQIGISLPHYSGYQQNMGRPVPMTALTPGDLVFKGYPVSYHVGMYAGNGTVIHAPHTGAVVSYTSLLGWQYAVRLP